MEWKDLEKLVTNLIKADNPRQPKGSGSTKKEEDVVGQSLIIQCKYSENKTISIQKNDLDRLLKASTLLDKFPLFINQNPEDLTITIPYTEDTNEILNSTFKFIIACKITSIIRNMIPNVKSRSDLRVCLAETRRAEKLLKEALFTIEDDQEQIKHRADSKIDDLTMYNLFEDNK